MSERRENLKRTIRSNIDDHWFPPMHAEEGNYRQFEGQFGRSPQTINEFALAQALTQQGFDHDRTLQTQLAVDDQRYGQERSLAEQGFDFDTKRADQNHAHSLEQQRNRTNEDLRLQRGLDSIQLENAQAFTDQDVERFNALGDAQRANPNVLSFGDTSFSDARSPSAVQHQAMFGTNQLIDEMQSKVISSMYPNVFEERETVTIGDDGTQTTTFTTQFNPQAFRSRLREIINNAQERYLLPDGSGELTYRALTAEERGMLTQIADRNQNDDSFLERLARDLFTITQSYERQFMNQAENYASDGTPVSRDFLSQVEQSLSISATQGMQFIDSLLSQEAVREPGYREAFINASAQSGRDRSRTANSSLQESHPYSHIDVPRGITNAELQNLYQIAKHYMDTGIIEGNRVVGMAGGGNARNEVTLREVLDAGTQRGSRSIDQHRHAILALIMQALGNS